MKQILTILVLFLGLVSCKDQSKNTGNTTKDQETEKEVVQRATFNADTAYAFVEKQVKFGPRVPGTLAHGLTANYLLAELKKYCDDAMIQEGEMDNQAGKKVPIRNIIGSFKPEASRRVLLCAHWDTRPQADEDPDRPTEPADGANDGASGVGVLLEIARQLNIKAPGLGVDIIFFDAEDMGASELGPESWCLGSQYWSNNPHVPNYVANYGILLDMVGAPNAVFALEGHSYAMAKHVVEKVWRTGQRLGYGNYFIMYQGGVITDDHYFINTVAHIPTIDIIHYEVGSNSGFGDFWHTHADNMEGISRETLKAVGETVLTVIYNEA